MPGIVGINRLGTGLRPPGFPLAAPLPGIALLGHGILVAPAAPQVTLATWQAWADITTPHERQAAVQANEVPFDALQGSQVGAFSVWTTESSKLAPVAKRADTPFVGASLGWAPTLWVHWTDDLPEAWHSRSRSDSEFVEAALPGGFGSRWLPVTDILAPGARRPPWYDAPYVGNSIGWAPTSWLMWSPDLQARRESAPFPSETFVEEALSGGGALSEFLPWGQDPPQHWRQAGSPQSDAPFDATVPPAVGEYQAWAPDTLHRQPKTGPTDIPFLSASLPIFAAASLGAWPDIATPRRRQGAIPDAAFLGGSPFGAALSEWLPLAPDATAARRQGATTQEAFLGAPLAFLGRFIAWADQALPGATRRQYAAPDTVLPSLTPALLGFAAWTTGSAPQWHRRTPPVGTEALDATVPHAMAAYLAWDILPPRWYRAHGALDPVNDFLGPTSPARPLIDIQGITIPLGPAGVTIALPSPKGSTKWPTSS